MIALQQSKVDRTLVETIKSIASRLNICKHKTKGVELMGSMDVAKEIFQHNSAEKYTTI